MANDEKNFLEYIYSKDPITSEEKQYFFQASLNQQAIEANHLIYYKIDDPSEMITSIQMPESCKVKITKGLKFQGDTKPSSPIDFINCSMHLYSNNSSISTQDVEISVTNDGIVIQGFSNSTSDFLKIQNFNGVQIIRDRTITSNDYGSLQILDSETSSRNCGMGINAWGAQGGLIIKTIGKRSSGELFTSEFLNLRAKSLKDNPTVSDYNREIVFIQGTKPGGGTPDKYQLTFSGNNGYIKGLKTPSSTDTTFAANVGYVNSAVNAAVANLKNELRAAGINLAD